MARPNRSKSRKRTPGWLKWARRSTQNALEMARLGRLRPADGAPFEVADRIEHCRLRRYSNAKATSAPLLLVPPLMLTAECYDIAPDISAVRMLVREGIDTWVVDFGAPEHEEGGMDRTLDDHVRCVSWAVERARAVSGRDVHLAGYSQGGMFAYQAAALRRCDGVASVITFGSPVDIHSNLPAVRSDIAGQVIRVLQPMVELTLDRMTGLPGVLSSTGFKLATPRKELEQLVDFVRKLHDRQALEKRESRRRFLGGEGFVAWPGPALRQFFKEFIVHNRMMSGGIVIDGVTVTLADIHCPILYFVGSRDDFARPASVHAVRNAAPDAEHHGVTLNAGHFGLVVGSTSLRETWPTVVGWMRWRDDEGPMPEALREPEPEPEKPRHNDQPEEYFEVDVDYELLTDEVVGAVRNGWRVVGDAFRDAGDTMHNLRWQLPRLTRLERMTGRTVVSASRTLAEQARNIPKATFFLWRDRAFSYADADARVGHVARGLIHCGIRPGDRVGVMMGLRPSYLSLVTALNRLGAIAVLFDPALGDDAVATALEQEPLRALSCDPEHLTRCRDIFKGDVLLLGGGGGRAVDLDSDGNGNVTDMEAIDPDSVELPSWYRADPGRARDLAMVLVRTGGSGKPKIARVTNGRWAFSALGVASAATLTPHDTVYSCLPLHHPAGILVSVGGALMGGARLALSPRFEADSFWSEVRRYGATVVFYAGEMGRPLINAPASHADRNHPVRLFAGSGMRADVWSRLVERFGVGVLEFYASTERNLVLANASGEKMGALGRPLPGSAEMALVRYDFSADKLLERSGRLRRCEADMPGVVIARARPYAHGPEIRRDVFVDGDRWYVTGDVLRKDRGGDYWFEDRLANMLRTPSGAVATPRIEDALYELPETELAVAYGVALDGEIQPIAAVVTEAPLDPERLSNRLNQSLGAHERPRLIYRVPHLPMTEGFRPIKAKLRDEGPEEILDTLRYDAAAEQYRVVTE